MAPAPAAPAGVGAARALRVELADIVRAHGAAYQPAHPLCRAQRRALRAIATCRTAALGGHRAVCTACGAERITYNSCRHAEGRDGHRTSSSTLTRSAFARLFSVLSGGS